MNKYLKIALLVLLPIAVMAQTFSVGKYAITNGTAQRSDANRWTDIGANILEFGADPTGATDSSAAIQAAIDSMTPSGPQNLTFCPGGTYKVTVPIFLDLPGNLRGADGVHGNAWNSGGNYSLNDTVNYLGIPYIALQSTTNNVPVSSPTFWQPFNWSNTTSYAANAVVRFQGVPWISLQGSNTGNTPSAASGNSTFWRAITLTQSGGGGSPGAGGNFSLGISGPEGLGWGSGFGCSIKPTFNNGLWIVVGIGQRMTVRNIALAGTVSCWRGSCDPNGIGIGIASDGAGVENALIENVNIAGPIYTLSETGFNGDGLGAETTWRKMFSGNCYNGIIINHSQNFINHVEDSNLGCVNDVIATSGPGIMIEGGAIGTEGSQGPVIGSFAISGTSALSPDHSTGAWRYFFSTVITPGPTGGGCQSGTSTPFDCITGCNPQGGCVLNRWTFPTAHYGIVPAFPVGYVAATKTMTFQIQQGWANWNFTLGSINNPNSADTYTDINAELQAVTTAYATEGVTMFMGDAFQVRHVHIENSPTCLELFNDTQTFAGDGGSIFEGLFFNYDIIGTGTLPANYCQLSWPFIDATNGATSFRFSQNRFSGSFAQSQTPLVIDIGPLSPTCYFDYQAYQVSNWAMRTINSGGNNPAQLGSQCRFNDPVFVQTGNNAPNQAQNQGLLLQQKLPQIGFFQGPGLAYLPIFNWTILQNVSGHTLDQYPPINGGQVYSVLQNNDWANNVPASATVAQLVQSQHKYYSWGQDITTSICSGLSWAYKGQTDVVLADSCSLGLLFPGLGITLDNGTGPQHYAVTATFPRTSLDGGTHPGYFTVLDVPKNSTPNDLLLGTKTTVYTCPGSCPVTKIGQDPFVWNILTEPQSTGTPTLTSCGTSPVLGAGSFNTFGSFTTGTGTPTACTVNFTPTFPTNASCTISPVNAAAAGIVGGTRISAQSAAAFTVTLGAGTNSAQYNYTCGGN